MKPIALVLVLLALSACKADRFDVAFSTGDIAAARAGAVPEAPFEMLFEGIGELDDDKRAELARFEAIVRDHMAIDAFIIEPGDDSADLLIEGRLPITAEAGAAAPYFLHVSPAADFAGFTAVEMKNGTAYGDMREQMQRIDFMMTPDRYQPARIELAGNGEAIIAPGAFVDGDPQALFRGIVSDRLWLSFKGGVYDDTGALLLIALP